MAEEGLTVIEIRNRLELAPAPISLDEARALAITDQHSLELAGDFIKTCKRMVKDIERQRLDITRGIDESKGKLIEQERKATAPLHAVLAILEPRYWGYIEEQRHLEREDQRRIEEAARKQAEEEQLAAAIAAEQAGASTAEVEAIVNEKPQVVMPVAPPRVERMPGVSTTTNYSAECTDKAAFLKWALAFRQYNLVDVNEPALNALARAQRDSFNVPGCRLVKKTGVRTRG